MTQEVTIPGRYDRVIDACKFIVAGAEQVGFGPNELFRIELACDEACTNVIQHAYGGEDKGNIRVTWHFADGAFTIAIYDQGEYFDPDSVPAPNIPASPDDFDELKIGGLGIHFMRSLMDEIQFHNNMAEGNQLIMVKYLSENNRQ
jgi:serine/threonine-protein kinase RsbW